jgi:putative ABC transport system substrate-binding protein
MWVGDEMTRCSLIRGILVTGMLAALAMPDVAGGQQAPKTHRIGYLTPGPAGCPPTAQSRAFRQGLIEAGYAEGRDVIVDRRCFPTLDMARKVLGDLLKAMPDVLVAASNPAAVAMRDGAAGIPVVFVNADDPVGSRMVHSIARPGGNMTGLADLFLALNAKRLQILKETLPGVRLVATLIPHDDSETERFRGEIEGAAAALGLQVRHFTVRTAEEVPGALEAMKKSDVQAFVVMQTPLFWTERVRIARLAAQHRLPGMYPLRSQAEEGGFISYGADHADLYRRAASYVVKILQGARPGDLPVEQPTKFELVINLRTAKLFGLAVPGAILLQADHLIE